MIKCINGINRVIPNNNWSTWYSYAFYKSNYMKYEDRLFFKRFFKRILGIEAIETAIYRSNAEKAIPKYKEGDWIEMRGFGRDNTDVVVGRVSMVEITRGFHYSAIIEYFIVDKNYQIWIGSESYVNGIVDEPAD